MTADRVSSRLIPEATALGHLPHAYTRVLGDNGRGRGRIVVACGRTGLRDLLSDWFAGHGYDIAQASNAAELLAAMEQDSPHLVLLDGALPDGSGRDVLKDLRGAYPGVDVIMLTGNKDFTVARAAVTVGAIDLDRLYRTVAARMQDPRRSAP